MRPWRLKEEGNSQVDSCRLQSMDRRKEEEALKRTDDMIRKLGGKLKKYHNTIEGWIYLLKKSLYSSFRQACILNLKLIDPIKITFCTDSGLSNFI